MPYKTLTNVCIVTQCKTSQPLRITRDKHPPVQIPIETDTYIIYGDFLQIKVNKVLKIFKNSASVLPIQNHMSEPFGFARKC